MLTHCLIFLGSGLGGLIRFGVSSIMNPISPDKIPYGTLLVNITGSFLIGVVAVLLVEKWPLSKPFLLIGLLGGYTTFSSFSLDTINLIENGNGMLALLNVILSIALCLLATWFGITCSKLL